MRTTVTLDADVAVRLERERKKRGQTFKDAVNDVLRAGLDALGHSPRRLAAVPHQGVRPRSEPGGQPG